MYRLNEQIQSPQPEMIKQDPFGKSRNNYQNVPETLNELMTQEANKESNQTNTQGEAVTIGGLNTEQALMEEERKERMKKMILENDEKMSGVFRVHGKKSLYAKKSLFLLTETNLLRKIIVWIVEWKWFDRLIMLAIVLNSLSLSMYDYTDLGAETKYNQTINNIGDAFTFLFLAEAILKVIAMGFVIHKKSYLRDGWNFVDFFIVVTGVVDYVASSINLKSLRTLRVLRPLKSINAIPSMRRLVTTLLQSLPELGNAAIFLSFMIILFGILGLQQFSGVMYYKCRMTPKPLNSTYWPKSPDFLRVCSISEDGGYKCPKGLYCGSPLDYGISLEDDGVYKDPTIQYGISSFDHFGQAVLGVFQTISKDGWSDLMYIMSDGSNQIFARIYFCCIIVIGSFFLLNLILAVIMANFTRISQIDEENELIKKEQKFKQTKKLNFKKLTTEDILNMDTSDEEDLYESIPAEGKEIEDSQSFLSKSITPNQTQKLPGRLDVERLDGSVEDDKSDIQIPKQQDALPLNVPQFGSSNNLAPPTPLSTTPYSAMLKQQKGNSKQKAKDFTTEYGIAVFEKASQQKNEGHHYHRATTSLKKFHEIENQMKESELIDDVKQRLKVQSQMFEQQKGILEKMEIDIKKKYAQSKRRTYGIDNEQEIVQEIKRGIKTQILQQEEEKRILDQEPEDSELKLALRQRENEEVQKELDEVTLMALKICSNLKQINLKQHLQDAIMQKYKSQLIQKNMLERMNSKVESQMTMNYLSIRAAKMPFYNYCLKIVAHKLFTFLIVLCILINAVVLAMDRYPQSIEEDNILNYFNLACFSVFGLELVLKIIGLGVVYYFRDKFNWFDSIVVFISIIEIILQYSNIGQNLTGGAISAMRVLRVIRIFQLAKVWKNFQELLVVIGNTIKDISNISILILLFIFTYTLLGMDLFAYNLKADHSNPLSMTNDPNYPVSTFDSFMRAFISVFIVLANDGWTVIYFDHYRASGSVTASIYFISLMIIGQYVLLNLFIAILIENFEQVSVHQDIVNKLNEGVKKQTITEQVMRFIYKVIRRPYPEIDESPAAQLQRRLADQNNQERASLYLFKSRSRIRKLAQKWATHKRFESIMLFIILLSSVQLAIDNPLNDPNSLISTILGQVDLALTALFTVEAILKIVAFGFMKCGSTSYIRSSWNQLDFFVVFISIISQMISSKNINSIKILRLLKVLRPLRVISKNQGLKISLRSLGKAVPGVINVSIIAFIFYLIFGIIGVNYLKGMYYYCSFEGLEIPSQFISPLETKWDCISQGGHWKNFFQNFDNIFNAIATLFTISTAVDWSDVMYRGASGRGPEQMPRLMDSQYMTLFFLAFMIVGNFFLLNLFVGVVISTYNREKEVLGRNFLLTEKQRKWLENKIMMVQSKPMLKFKLPAKEWRQPVFMLAEFKWFDRFIYFCIIANTVVLSIQWQNQPQIWNSITEKINYAFAVIFTFEVVVKFIAYGNRYFKDGWNNFDIVIVFMTLISIVLAATTSYQLGPQTTIIRSFRIGRIFKLFRRNKSLKSIFQTFLVTLPAMANVGSLLILFIFIYAILGMYIFADIKLNGELTDDANFQNVSNAFFLLIRISTGESWAKLMNALQQEYSISYQCISSPTYDDYAAAGSTTVGCGSYIFPIIYFNSYIVVNQLIYLKLFIAIILQGFQDTTERDNKLLDQEANDKFREVWANYDPDGTTFMSAQSYGLFLGKLGEPLGWEEDYTYNYLKQLNYLDEVSLPKYNAGKDYQFMDVFESLALLMIVKKEVKKYLINYTRKMKMIKSKKEQLEQRKKEAMKRRKSQKMLKQQTLQQKTPIIVKKQTNVSVNKKEMPPKQNSVKDIFKSDLRVKNKIKNYDSNTDNSIIDNNIQRKQKKDTRNDNLLYQEADQHNEELQNQLKRLINNNAGSDLQAGVTTTTIGNGNSRMNSNNNNGLNQRPRQSVGLGGDVRSDLNEDDIEAQINELLQNNSLLEDLGMKLTQDNNQASSSYYQNRQQRN